jgi:hypothetical protein
MQHIPRNPAIGFVIGILPALCALVLMQVTGQDWVSTGIVTTQVWISVGCSGLLATYLSRRHSCPPQV